MTDSQPGPQGQKQKFMPVQHGPAKDRKQKTAKENGQQRDAARAVHLEGRPLLDVGHQEMLIEQRIEGIENLANPDRIEKQGWEREGQGQQQRLAGARIPGLRNQGTQLEETLPPQ